jgi:hypothetical protein
MARESALVLLEARHKLTVQELGLVKYVSRFEVRGKLRSTDA